MRKRLLIATAGLLATGAFALLAWSGHGVFFGDSEPGPNPRMVSQIVTAAESSHLLDDELIIGTLIAGQARAYPIGYLRRGEHVNDRIGGLPVCASW